MSLKTKKKIQLVISLALTAMFLACVPCTEVAAAETNVVDVDKVEVLEATVYELPGDQINVGLRTMLAQCIISVSSSSEGMLVDITTGATGIASVIGVKDIKIQKKVWYGWSTVAVSSGGEANDCASMGCSVLYTGAVKGETYRVTCVHYADVDGYEEGENNTGEFVFTY